MDGIFKALEDVSLHNASRKELRVSEGQSDYAFSGEISKKRVSPRVEEGASRQRRSIRPARKETGEFQSGQMGQTVNLLSLDFGGSNPSLPTTSGDSHESPLVVFVCQHNWFQNDTIISVCFENMFILVKIN